MSVTVTALPTNTNQIALANVPRGAEALVLHELLRGGIGEIGEQKVILHVASSDRVLDTLAQQLPFFCPDAEILLFPAWDCLPYDRVSPRADILATRLQTLSKISLRDKHKPLIVLTTVNALIQRVPPRSEFATAGFTAKTGENVSRETLLDTLANQGYRRSSKAIEAGEYAVRGSIVDLIPPGSAQGMRLDWFGDTLESIRLFDPMTQISDKAVEGVSLYPVSEILLSEESIERFRRGYREAFGAVSKEDPLYEAISSGATYPGMEHWLPLFYEKPDTIFDYLPDALVTFDDHAEETLAERFEAIADYYQSRVDAKSIKQSSAPPYHPLPPEKLYLMRANLEQRLIDRPACYFSAFDAGSERPSFALPYRPGANLAAMRHDAQEHPIDQLREYAQQKRAKGKATLLACFSNGSRERLFHMAQEKELHVVTLEQWSERKSVSGKSIGIATLPLENGFETDEVVIVTEQDLLGERIIRSRPKKRKSEAFLSEVANFSEGELVVHREHGIGRFEGLIAIEVTGAKHDCLKLVYADGDKLFLPVENIDLLSRYGSDDEGAQLDKLGAASWQARKAKTKERIRIAAEALMKIAAARHLKPGEMLYNNTQTYEAFCDRFPYMETDDQQRSIEEVINDLQAGKPMDRLICGDVGFGKTEVALRAAFIATHSEPKVQVAVIVPTTLLARQHYKNFKQRFEGFNVDIRQLSRMVPAKQQRAAKEGLAEGTVDIVIGTHALLSKSIEFMRLGLVIVDEEQHFGVGQKEKLKELKADVHVLTLSATPIPRTLQLALTGVRDLSLITTPPVDRLAVRSFVTPFDPVVLREAILREMHRSGRVFVVTPRIKDMAELRVQLHELVPEAKIAAAHGQMAPTDLDSIMNDFYDGKYDVLLSTAIIESGLDIPTANTIIINRADRFGLAQLYQMRGRVGRGKLRAYAYFLLPARRDLTDTATRRLEVMQSLDSLGAGFALASHDMDIRGCGNLVGEEQSGHVREVGVELYQHMLEQAIEELKREVGSQPAAEEWSPQIALGMPVLIPEDYVSDLALRMGLYRRAASLQTPEEIDSFIAELTDRFGPVPPEAQNLLATVRLKQLCKLAGIERVDTGPKGAVITFRLNSFRAPEKLIAYISKHFTLLKLRPDQKLIYSHEWNDDGKKVARLTSLLHDIAAL